MVTLAWSGLGLRDHELTSDQMKNGLFVRRTALKSTTILTIFPVVLPLRHYLDLLGNDSEMVHRLHHPKNRRRKEMGHLVYLPRTSAGNAHLRVDRHLPARPVQTDERHLGHRSPCGRRRVHQPQVPRCHVDHARRCQYCYGLVHGVDVSAALLLSQEEPSLKPTAKPHPTPVELADGKAHQDVDRRPARSRCLVSTKPTPATCHFRTETKTALPSPASSASPPSSAQLPASQVETTTSTCSTPS